MSITLERTISAGIIVTLAVQSASVIKWGGAAEARLAALEQTTYANPPIVERLARLETHIDLQNQSLMRIETRLNLQQSLKQKEHDR